VRNDTIPGTVRPATDDDRPAIAAIALCAMTGQQRDFLSLREIEASQTSSSPSLIR
jgi:hypothetical protein